MTMTVTKKQLNRALADACCGHEALRPPNRMTVSEGAANNLVFMQPGSAGGPWSGDETPYMIEPMNTLASRHHEALCFVGPARTGKTGGLLLGWMAHAVCNDPGDMLMIQMSKDKAREFSKTDVDRAIRHSPNVRNMKSPRVVDSNTFDTMFRHGMWLRIAWPTVTNVSGSTYRYVAITDLDRIENAENVDGEGPLFDLARKRTTTYQSRGMCLAESSPGLPITDPNWIAATPHEAPPVTGILGIYNQSDRRRLYWRCPHCSDRFEAKPGLSLFGLPDDDQLIEEIRTLDIEAMAADYGKRIICPHCGCMIPVTEKMELNRGGAWITEAEIMGRQSTSNIAGYWMGGVAAAYQNWRSLVSRHLKGLQDYALTGSEERLKATINTDQGLPYMSMHLKEASKKAAAVDKLVETDMQRYIVPPETRAVVASVDVQGGTNARFIVQVHAIGPFMEQWLVNRYAITKSKREGMGEEFAPIDPGQYPEDWDVLTEQVVNATYRTPIEGKEIKTLLTVVDTGGEEGVSHNAYAWYRRLRAKSLTRRVRLYKGDGRKNNQIIRETRVGRKNASDKGDIPLLICDTNKLADMVDTGLRRNKPGPGYYHFPPAKGPDNPNGWLLPAFFDELKAEVRGPDGTWSQIKKRNESFDLCRMILVGLLTLGIDKIRDWSNVATWLKPLEENSEVVTVEQRREAQEEVAEAVKLAAPRRPRRVGFSSYLR
jgi:phage terminase large subunit GpA-like protein